MGYLETVEQPGKRERERETERNMFPASAGMPSQ